MTYKVKSNCTTKKLEQYTQKKEAVSRYNKLCKINVECKRTALHLGQEIAHSRELYYSSYCDIRKCLSSISILSEFIR